MVACQRGIKKKHLSFYSYRFGYIKIEALFLLVCGLLAVLLVPRWELLWWQDALVLLIYSLLACAWIILRVWWLLRVHQSKAVVAEQQKNVETCHE